MKTSFKAIFAFLFSLIFVVSCSRKKDKFISRNYHAVTAEFNALYNGHNALEEGRTRLNESYFDNYWEILPIERMQISDEVILPGQSQNESFTIAEEKAAKAIQKHSMNIGGREKNPQMDEAYLLLGKARYFDQRFIPALEAFNYILYKYPASDKINQAKVWREKSNIRLDNNELAIENLKRLLRQEELEDQDLADATSILAQAYINTKSLDSAITQLEIAASATKSNDERGRYKFIQGQLYNHLGLRDSANIAFDKVIELNRKTPRIYMIVAHLQKINNFDIENGDQLEIAELFAELEENRENRPYLDKIYHQIGGYHLKNGSDSLAVAYYNKSLDTKSQDQLLNARNYEILGDLFFDYSEYAIAGQYYDSTMGSLVENSKPFRVIKRKRDNLEDVIYYEAIATRNDSVLTLVNFSDEERLTYFGSYIDDLKLQLEEEKAEEERAALNTGLVTANNSNGVAGARTGTPNQATLFYFYNPTTVAYGKNEFVKTWGDRPLEDNWRWSNLGLVSETDAGVQNDNILDAASNEELFDPQFYISKIPSEQKVIDSISRERNFAYYQLGLIYKEKFSEYELAKDKLQNLLKSDPEERLILPTKYNLLKIYELLGQNGEASIAKNEIIANYPESRYAAILQNPDLVSDRDENSPESLYEDLYAKHVNQEYEEVISKCEEYITAFDGDPMVPKFELLKATAAGRFYGYEAYRQLINNLAVTYANTPEGREAQDIESRVLPLIANSDFVTEVDSIPGNVKLVFQFEGTKTEDVLSFKETLDEVLENIRYYDLKSSRDVYSPEITFIVVHGFTNSQVARTFDQLLNKEDKKKITKPFFVVSSTNYQIIQIHKNLNVYLNINNK